MFNKAISDIKPRFFRLSYLCSAWIKTGLTKVQFSFGMLGWKSSRIFERARSKIRWKMTSEKQTYRQARSGRLEYQSEDWTIVGSLALLPMRLGNNIFNLKKWIHPGVFKKVKCLRKCYFFLLIWNCSSNTFFSFIFTFIIKSSLLDELWLK